VFGWTTLALDAGEMWTLPDYGDHLKDPQGATLIASQFVRGNKDVAGETEADVGAA
jgi:hypothetical protein